MSLSLAQVEEQVFMLPQDQQIQLIHDVLAKQPLSKTEEAQLREAKQRSREIDEGKVELLDRETVMKSLKAELGIC
jgi:Putative addiction module component